MFFGSGNRPAIIWNSSTKDFPLSLVSNLKLITIIIPEIWFTCEIADIRPHGTNAASSAVLPESSNPGESKYLSTSSATKVSERNGFFPIKDYLQSKQKVIQKKK